MSNVFIRRTALTLSRQGAVRHVSFSWSYENCCIGTARILTSWVSQSAVLVYRWLVVVFQVFELGKQNRATAYTDMNEHSSRSHALLCATIIGVNTSTGSRTTGNPIGQPTVPYLEGRGRVIYYPLPLPGREILNFVLKCFKIFTAFARMINNLSARRNCHYGHPVLSSSTGLWGGRVYLPVPTIKIDKTFRPLLN